LTDKYAESMSQLKLLHARATTLANRLEKGEDQPQVDKAEMEAKDAEIIRLQHEIEDKVAEVQNLERELSAAKHKLQIQEQEFTHDNLGIEEIEGKLKSEASKAQRLEKKLADERARTQVLEQELQSMESKIKELEQESSDEKFRVQSLKKEIVELRQQVAKSAENNVVNARQNSIPVSPAAGASITRRDTRRPARNESAIGLDSLSLEERVQRARGIGTDDEYAATPKSEAMLKVLEAIKGLEDV